MEVSGHTQITVGDILAVAYADDTFLVNIHCHRDIMYLGYNNEVPEELKTMPVNCMYLDWADEALGIEVSAAAK